MFDISRFFASTFLFVFGRLILLWLCLRKIYGNVLMLCATEIFGWLDRNVRDLPYDKRAEIVVFIRKLQESNHREGWNEAIEYAAKIAHDYTGAASGKPPGVKLVYKELANAIVDDIKKMNRDENYKPRSWQDY
jgi:hypothetical protein